MNNGKKEKSSMKSPNCKLQSYLHKFQTLKKHITVEPLIALYQMGIYLSRPALDNLELENACRVVLNYSDTVCDTILSGNHENLTDENGAIQVVISEMHSWQRPMQCVMPLLLGLFLGSFSDRYKLRKPFLLMPVLGEIFGSIGCLLCVIYMKLWSLNVQGVFQKVVPSFFGGQTMMLMATTSYIADISPVEMRTLRLGIVQLVLSVTSPLVSSFSGILFVRIGYYGVLNLTFLVLLFAFCYGLFYINEQCDKPVSEIVRNIFDIKYPLDTLSMLYKKSPENNRNNFGLMIAVIIIYRAAFDGESNVLYLYTQNVFQWTPVQFSYFLTVNGLVLLIGNAISLPLFTRAMKLSDPMILLLTIFMKVISNIAFGLARTPELFYTGVVASIITRMYRVAKKSFSTKIVSVDDIGKAQSLISVFEAVSPAASVPLYNLIYVHTLVSQPSTFFFFSIILYGICCILILWIYIPGKIQEKKDCQESKSETIIETVYI